MSEWQDILHRIGHLRREKAARGSRELWFRGQRCNGWGLVSRLHRLVADTIGEQPGAFLVERLLEIEKTLYQRFRASSAPLLGQNNGLFATLFAMQHHGVSTRLLDFTRSFSTALYFAQDQWFPEHHAAIYILDPELLNKETIGIDGIVLLDSAIETRVGHRLASLVSSRVFQRHWVRRRNSEHRLF